MMGRRRSRFRWRIANEFAVAWGGGERNGDEHEMGNRGFCGSDEGGDRVCVVVGFGAGEEVIFRG